MIRRVLFAVLGSGLVLGAAGCRHKCCSGGSAPPPRPFLPPPPGGPFIGPPTGAGGTNIPPAGVPTTPGGSLVPPAGPGGFPPPDFGTPRPGNGGRPAPELLLPENPPGGPSSRSNAPPFLDGILGAPTAPKDQSPEPPVASSGEPLAPKAAAAGLPGFVQVKEGVASGRRPDLDGFDALKRNGYRTAVYLHAAGADTSAARDLAEKKGLAFVAIETTPEKLADAAAAFDRVVNDRPAKPAYVFDDDGTRAGAVWYLHFRTADQMSPDAARIRARSLGLTDQTDDGKAFWVAIQQILSNR